MCSTAKIKKEAARQWGRFIGWGRYLFSRTGIGAVGLHTRGVVFEIKNKASRQWGRFSQWGCPICSKRNGSRGFFVCTREALSSKLKMKYSITAMGTRFLIETEWEPWFCTREELCSKEKRKHHGNGDALFKGDAHLIKTEYS